MCNREPTLSVTSVTPLTLKVILINFMIILGWFWAYQIIGFYLVISIIVVYTTKNNDVTLSLISGYSATRLLGYSVTRLLFQTGNLPVK